MQRIICFIIIICFCYHDAYNQLVGCTDPQAENFNANATVNNGSCTYPQTDYTPELVARLPNSLKEISGLIYFQNKLLALNDGGGGNKLYFLDTINGNILQTITVDGASNIDWEDIAQDSDYVYIGDIGNNAHGNRKDLCIYKIAKLEFNHTGDFAIPAKAVEKISYSYEDQADLSAQPANSTRYDCESLLVLRGKIHLFTKNWMGDYSVHYTLPMNAGVYKALLLDSINTGGNLLTGADAGAYDEIIFTSYNKGAGCSFFLVYGFDNTDFFFNTGNRRQITLPGVLVSGQLESVCFVNGVHGFIANEYFSKSIISVSNKLFRFNTNQWLLDYYRQNPLAAEKGMLRYNSTTNKYEVFTGTVWETLN